MARFYVTEKSKDNVLNVLVVLSVMLLCAYLTNSSNPRKANTPSPLVYTNNRLQHVATKEFPVFPTLQTIDVPVTHKSKSNTVADSNHADSNLPAQQTVSVSSTQESNADLNLRQLRTPELLQPIRNILTATKSLNLL
jgi:hypothetical protein